MQVKITIFIFAKNIFMSIFKLYFNLGFEHISDFAGYDHILFLLALCAVYDFRQWKNVLVLVTAFTIGHSVTLVLATFNIIKISNSMVEFLIPITILITALGNIFQKKEKFSKSLHSFKYFVAMIFGLIHGLGFSNYLRELISSENGIFRPLLGFNLGLEFGQIVIIIGILFVGFIFANFLKVKKREWNLVISGAALGISIVLMV